VSFNNDEDGDGLAALFGGITPQGAPDAEPGPRRAAQQPADAPAAPPPSPAPQYPGLAPEPYGAPPAPSAPAPVTPAWEMPAPAQPPQPAGQPYPQATQFPHAPQYPQTPAYEMPAPAAPPAYEMPAPTAPPAYEMPAPAAPPQPTYGAPPAPHYPGLTPASPYPPTAQYPAPVDPVASPPPASDEPPMYRPRAADAAPADDPRRAYDRPVAYDAPAAYDPPAPSRADDPALRAAPQPVVEPPAFGGFDALGLQPPEPRSAETPGGMPAAEHPLVRADAAPLATVFPPGPLLPDSTAAVESPEELGRSTVVERIGLVLAVLTGPLGLLMAIVTAARGVRRRGWLNGIGRASLALAVISTIMAGIGGYVLWNLRLDQLEHDEVAAASAEFCAAGAADPAIVSAPLLGWPSPGATISDSLTSMQAWTDEWVALAATSPAELRDGLDLLAARGQTIIDAVAGSRIIDRETNEQQITSIEGQSGVAGWYATYCAEP
jgi:hypothetical protein